MKTKKQILVVEDNEINQEIISSILENDFNVTEETKKRVHEFFPMRDDENCERIFEAISNLR